MSKITKNSIPEPGDKNKSKNWAKRAETAKAARQMGKQLRQGRSVTFTSGRAAHRSS